MTPITNLSEDDRSLEEIQKDIFEAELECWKRLWAKPCKPWQPDPLDDGDPYAEGLRKGRPGDNTRTSSPAERNRRAWAGSR